MVLPTPQPYHVRVEDSLVDDLQQRLRQVRWPDQDVPNDDWAYGSDLHYIRRLADYWKTSFRWRDQEKYLNSGFGCNAKHYTLNLPMEPHNPGAGLRIHYVHAVADGGGVPLLLLHGWPGSFFEFHKIFPMLVRFGFDVVAPSLPGYAFSDRPQTKHFDTAAMARTMDLLMRSLGYKAYIAQGGDWGSVICKTLGQLASTGQISACKAIHLNMIVVPTPPRSSKDANDKEEGAVVQRNRMFEASETGYQKIQGTKPQTLGFALADSPVGLLAWVVEKFRSWSDCSGDPERAFSRDDILTSVMLYWASGCITSSMRLYYETIGTGAWHGGEARNLWAEKVTVPTGLARFPKEPFKTPRSWAKHTFTQIVRDTELPRGGHFAAWEVPDLLADELRRCYMAGGPHDARTLCGKSSAHPSLRPQPVLGIAHRSRL